MRTRFEVVGEAQAKIAARAYADSIPFSIAFDFELQDILEELERRDRLSPDEEDRRNNLRIHLDMPLRKQNRRSQ